VRPRERELLPREREPLLPFFELELRDDLAATPERPDDEDLRVPVDLRAPPDLLAPEERLEPEPDDLARLDDRLAPEAADFARDELERFAVERFAAERFAAGRLPVARFADDLRAPLLRDEDADPKLDPPLELSLGDHLPDITRCAASATASAISEPSLAALEAMLLAACCAVSAASSPASRIFLRAAGLALIAAAAAARPAASISLLIAAFASLSTVLPLELGRDDDPERGDDEREPEDEDLPREELLRVDLAIVYLPPSGERHFRAVPVP
jgi:hypothetical protein